MAGALSSLVHLLAAVCWCAAATATVLQAAGSSTNFGFEDDTQFSPLDDIPAELRLSAPEQTQRVVGHIQSRRSLAAMAGEHKPLKQFVPLRNRKLSMVYAGDRSRFRLAIDRYNKGENLTIGIVGGSISAGAGAVDAHSWTEWLQDFLELKFDRSRLNFHNGAVPGTLSSYMAVCHNVHVPQLADIVFVEYSLNDEHAHGPAFDNPTRRPFERLLRKLLTYPRRPAVVIYNAYSWFSYSTHLGRFYASAERQFYEFATYYQLPMISVKASVWRFMHDNVPGYNISRPRSDNGFLVPELDPQLKGNVYFYDRVHPDGWTGHTVMAELALHLFDEVHADVMLQPIQPQEHGDVHVPLPPPMIPNNHESVSDKCFIGDNFIKSVIPSDGWTWANDAKPNQRPKYGFISSTPGAALRIKVNTTASSRSNAGEHLVGGMRPPQQPGADMVSIELAHLKSYHGMGQASVTCEAGCTCTFNKLDGHQKEKNSQLNLHTFQASQADECVIVVTVLQESSSGATKVKIMGVMVSDENGAVKASGNWAAVEYVHDAATMPGAGGQFNLQARTP